MYSELLKKAGLTGSESEVLDYLYTRGVCKASTIAVDLKRPRAAVYKVLENLIHLGLAEKISKLGKIDTFRAEHPSQLEKLYEDQEKKLSQTKKQYQEALPDLISNFNLAHNKPGVRFYEGEDGVRKVLEDTLRSKTEILLFLNTNELSKESTFNEINNEYKKKRERLGIKKKIIRTGKAPLPYLQKHEGVYEKVTEIRYLEKIVSPFKSSIQIYDNKISYQVFDDNKVVSVLIEDKNIYGLNKTIFDHLWSECL